MEKYTLEVGNDGREVIINHPDLMPDENGVGHITFSPEQARGLAALLLKNANELDPATPSPGADAEEVARKLVTWVRTAECRRRDHTGKPTAEDFSRQKCSECMVEGIAALLESFRAPSDADMKRCIGNVLDFWEQVPNDFRGDPGFEHLDKALKELYLKVTGRKPEAREWNDAEHGIF